VHRTKPVRCLDIQASFFYFFCIYYTHRGAQWFLRSCSDSAKSSCGQRGLEGRHQPSGLHLCNYLATYMVSIENLLKKTSLIATTQEDRGRGHATPKPFLFSCTGCFPLHSDGCYEISPVWHHSRHPSHIQLRHPCSLDQNFRHPSPGRDVVWIRYAIRGYFLDWGECHRDRFSVPSLRGREVARSVLSLTTSHSQLTD
jgi:hypothetical protein